MDKLKSMIEDMFLHAQTLEAGNPGVRAVKRHLQQMSGELGFTDLALELRGKIASGEGAGRTGRSALVQTNRASGRFNTKPPEEVFVNPNIPSPNNVGPAANEEGEQDAEAESSDANVVYAKISKMAPSAILSVYGETSIMGMISALGGSIEAEKSPNQKAAYLKALIKERSETPAE
jgi:hypothetical protein